MTQNKKMFSVSLLAFILVELLFGFTAPANAVDCSWVIRNFNASSLNNATDYNYYNNDPTIYFTYTIDETSGTCPNGTAFNAEVDFTINGITGYVVQRDFFQWPLAQKTYKFSKSISEINSKTSNLIKDPNSMVFVLSLSGTGEAKSAPVTLKHVDGNRPGTKAPAPAPQPTSPTGGGNPTANKPAAPSNQSAGGTTTPTPVQPNRNPVPTVKTGAQKTIEQLLCTPTENLSGHSAGQGSETKNAAGGDLFYCVNKLYRVGIAVGAVAAVLLLVVAGYLYAAGGEESVSEAKAIMGSTVAGLVVLLISFIFLKTINPDLIQFKPLQLPQFVNPVDTDLCNPAVQDCIYRIDGSISGVAGAAGSAGKPGNAAAQSGPGNSAALAKQIQTNSNIQLATAHPSSSDPLSTSKKNIDDTAAGTLAKTSKDGDAKGVSVQLSDNMLKGMLGVAAKFKIAISEIAGGDHSGSSAHYRGNAFDINTINGQGATSANSNIKPVMDLCRSLGAVLVLGPAYPGHAQDEGHGTHVHCGW